MAESIVAQLRDERIRSKISIRQLAEMSGVNYTNIAKIERREVSPTVETTEKLAKALGKEITLK